MGPRCAEILAMINRDYVRWVIIAFIISVPVSWFAMHKWLQNFAYKTELSWWIFALAGLMALGIALSDSELAELESSNEKSGGGITI